MQILSDLLVVCEDLNTMDNASKNIHVFADRLEKRLLDRFEAAAMAEGKWKHLKCLAQDVCGVVASEVFSTECPKLVLLSHLTF